MYLDFCLTGTIIIEMEWRTVTITLLSSSLIWTDTWWPWSYCSILDLRLGLYIAATLSVHLSCAPYKVTSEQCYLLIIHSSVFTGTETFVWQLPSISVCCKITHLRGALRVILEVKVMKWRAKIHLRYNIMYYQSVVLMRMMHVLILHNKINPYYSSYSGSQHYRCIYTRCIYKVLCGDP